MMREGVAALKGCAPRTGKPAWALDRDATPTRRALMPLRKISDRGEKELTESALM
jgi:hypothetical protein